jgi:hypothetical protein
MNRFRCRECQAIYEELLEAARTIPDAGAGLHDLQAWFEQFSEEEWAQMRQTSPLWKTWRRLQEHRALTGHTLSVLPVAPDALSNPN